MTLHVRLPAGLALALLLPGLLAAACSTTEPAAPADATADVRSSDRQELSAPSATPTEEPTVTPTPEPPPTPTPEPPTPTATPVPPTNANLTFGDPEGWVAPLIVSTEEGVLRDTAELSLDDVAYISLSIANIGSEAAVGPFFVDVYFDDFVVHRFTTRNGLDAGAGSEWLDWRGLSQVVRIEPGEHSIRLVVDSTDLVREIDETDNVYERSFVWTPSGEPATAPALRSRLPNLAPITPDGWDAPLVAASYLGATESGPLSVDAKTFLKYGFANVGPTSVFGEVLVDVYLDDKLVNRDSWSRLSAGDVLERVDWAGLPDTVRLEPGRHTLTLKIDATDLVEESDEDDNVVSLEFSWGTGDVPGRPATASLDPILDVPEPLSLPNLVPGWLWGWDGPIVVSHQAGTFQDDYLTVARSPFVGIVVFNESIVGVTEPFSIDLYVDGEKVNTFVMGGLTPERGFRIVEDWDRLESSGRMTVGPHTFRIVIDPDNDVAEADEADNVFEKTLVWASGADVEEPGPVVYTDAQLRNMLAGLRDLLDTPGPVLRPGGADLTREVMRVVDAGYYLMTGTSVADERLEVVLLPRTEYEDWIWDSYSERFAVSRGSDYPVLMRARERDSTVSSGLIVRRFGKIVILGDAENPIADVVTTVVHELGHMRQDLVNPAQTETGSSLELAAVREASAQQFERAFWLAIERFTGLDLLKYPDYPSYRALVEGQLNEWLAGYRSDEHSLGHLVQWLAVMVDPSLREAAADLVDDGELTLESSLAVYERLIRMPPDVVGEYVGTLVDSLERFALAIRAFSLGRLVPGQDPDAEGLSSLRTSGLTTP